MRYVRASQRLKVGSSLPLHNNAYVTTHKDHFWIENFGSIIWGRLEKLSTAKVYHYLQDFIKSVQAYTMKLR
jgi:hypothetical protein